MAYRTILLDLDNTLLDFDAASRLSWNDLMLEYGLPCDDEHYGLYHQINRRLWSQLEEGTTSQATIKTQRWNDYYGVIKAYRDPVESNAKYFEGLAKHPVMIPYADEVLTSLVQTHQVAIVTNGIGEVQRRRLAKVGWDQLDLSIVISDEIGVAKPNPAFLDYTFAQLSEVDLSTSLIVGDTLKSDIKGGIDYGIATCWHRYQQESLHGPYSPTYQIDGLQELLDIV